VQRDLWVPTSRWELLRSQDNIHLIGYDNVNDYYDVSLKEWRLRQIAELAEKMPGSSWTFVRGNLADKKLLKQVFERYHPSVVVNLAAQAGVRYSIENPDAYIEANLIGFYNILECCRHYPVKHLVYASSSSVYGTNAKMPYSTDDKTDHPVSLYAATKKSNELLAHSYSKLYNIPATGLRFFTVYGPAGRPDMAYFSFANKLVRGETIKIFNYGNCRRDFTYIDDIVEGVVRVMQHAPEAQDGKAPCKVYNIGNSNPRIFWISCGYFRRNYSRRVSSRTTTTSSRTRNWFPCSQATWSPRLPMFPNLNATSDSGRLPPCVKGCDASQNGTRISILYKDCLNQQNFIV
jgi:UDP-glucuronate 4-epimerase